jgi:predicted nucleotide-binding protein
LKVAIVTGKPKHRKKRLLRRRVFVVHGRNHEAREAMDKFLYSIGLIPLYFDEARKLTGKATPFVLDVVNRGLATTQATVVLMTLDDVGCLRQRFRAANEPAHETQLTAKPRQNVIFEAGMAMALRPDKTVLVELGDAQTHTISDLAGLHTIRMNNSIEKRKLLLDSLETSGCRVDKSGKEWKDREKGGDFDAAAVASKYDDNEIERMLHDEMRPLEGKVAEPPHVVEQPEPIREGPPKPIRESEAGVLRRTKAIQTALEELNTQVDIRGWGALLHVTDVETIRGGPYIVLVEGKGVTSQRVHVQFRVRVRDSRAYVLRLTREQHK